MAISIVTFQINSHKVISLQIHPLSSYIGWIRSPNAERYDRVLYTRQYRSNGKEKRYRYRWRERERTAWHDGKSLRQWLPYTYKHNGADNEPRATLQPPVVDDAFGGVNGTSETPLKPLNWTATCQIHFRSSPPFFPPPPISELK